MRRFKALSALGLAVFLVSTAGAAIVGTGPASASPGGVAADVEFIREFVEVGLDRSVAGVRDKSEEPGSVHHVRQAQS